MNKYAFRPAPLSLAISTAVASVTAHAATITVTTHADGPLGSITDECTLRAAVAAANDGITVDGCPAGSAGADEIVFDAGLAHSTITLADGELLIDNNLSITGPVPGDAGGITIDADDASRLFRAYGADVGLRGLTLTGGRLSGGTSNEGAAVRVNGGGNLTLRDSRVSGHSVVGRSYGGGIFVVDGNASIYDSEISGNSVDGLPYGVGIGVSRGDLVIRDSVIEGNVGYGTRGRGGGVNLRGGKLSVFDSEISGNRLQVGGASGVGFGGAGIFADSSDVTIVDSTIAGNAVEGDHHSGGGVFVFAAKAAQIQVEVIGSSILNNTTSGAEVHGGGLAVVSDESPAEVEIVNSTISGNVTAGNESHGGGIAGKGLPGYGSGPIPVDIIMRNTIVTDNSTQGADSSGGGVWVRLGDAQIEHSTISDNSTAGGDAFGGGLAVKYGDAHLVNSTVSGNKTSEALAGGLFVFTNELHGGGDATLEHSTVAYNTSGVNTDGAVVLGDLRLRNSLLVQAGGDERACNAPVAEHVNSLVTDDSCTGTATSLSDIALAPLADNGGSTPTHAVEPGSAAVDAAGDCPDDFGVTRDQRGMPRPGPSSAACDIGAYERGQDTVFGDRFEF